MIKRILKSNLYRNIVMLTVVPMLLVGILVLTVGSRIISNNMQEETRNELKSVAGAVEVMYDELYPGDYYLVGEEAFDIMKGDAKLNGDYSIVDELKEISGLDITLFYEDTRILTTVRDEQGVRIVGTGANALVLRDVLQNGNEAYYNEVMIDKDQYFAYYKPLVNSDGSIHGMIFVGKPIAQLEMLVKDSVRPLLLFDIGMVLVVILICGWYFAGLINALDKVGSFVNKSSNGDLDCELDYRVAHRADEIGVMANRIKNMQNALRDMVQLDTLTELFNRRSGNQKIQNMMDESDKTGTTMSLAIGDIDFFKKVNDTYGHNGGDEVLKAVAKLLKGKMKGRGIVVRWGGEEMLLVFENATEEKAYEELNAILEEIRALDVVSEDKHIHITMSFGVAAYESGMSEDELIKMADDRLYYGKEHGRNQVVDSVRFAQSE